MHDSNLSIPLIPLPPSRPPLSSSHLDFPAGPHRQTKELRNLFRDAFDRLGGVDWLVQFAQENDQNARVFVQAISKLLPPTISDGKGQPVIIDIPWLTRDRLAYKDKVSEARVISEESSGQP